MKQYKILIGLIFITFSMSFVFNKQNVPQKFKTFDEYKMKGIPFDSSYNQTYVIVLEKKDTIQVQISTDSINIKSYVYKKDHWFSKSSKYIDHSDNSGRKVRVNEYNEKYIYNDTIIHYNYMVDVYEDSIYFNSDYIILETPNRKFYFSYDNLITKMIYEQKDERHKFTLLKKIVKNYEDIFICKNYPIIVYPIRSYSSYKKVIIDDTLFLYSENCHNDVKILDDKRILNSLGEFDPLLGESIMDNR